MHNCEILRMAELLKISLIFVGVLTVFMICVQGDRNHIVASMLQPAGSDLISVGLLLTFCMTCVKGRTDHISIAALLPARKELLFSMDRVSPAITIAIEKITSRNGVLADRKIRIRYRDSKCSSAVAMNEVINFFIEDQFHVVFGPCCDYPAAPIARQMKFWNLPMITVGAMAVDFVDKTTEYPMVTRTGPTINFLAEYLVEILKDVQVEEDQPVVRPHETRARRGELLSHRRGRHPLRDDGSEESGEPLAGVFSVQKRF